MLWSGVDLKLGSPSGGMIGDDWQRSFYAHFDAFLSATRSLAQVIWLRS
jgi:hypothetical protein